MINYSTINGFHVNSIPCKSYDADLVENADYSVEISGIEITSEYVASSISASLQMYNSTEQYCTMKLAICFVGKEPCEAEVNYSKFTAECMKDVCDITFDSGDKQDFTGILTSIDSKTVLFPGVILAEFLFYGFCHDKKIKITSKSFFARGTRKKMSCKITTVVSKTTENYKFAGVTWKSVQEGDVLVLDGFKKRVLRNGGSDILNTDIVDMPTVSPGFNRIECIDDIELEYVPAYV